MKGQKEINFHLEIPTFESKLNEISSMLKEYATLGMVLIDVNFLESIQTQYNDMLDHSLITTFKDFFYTDATHNQYFKLRNILNPFKVLNENEGYRNFVYNNMVYRICKKKINNFKPNIIHITHPKLACAVFKTNIPFIVSCYSEEIVDSFPIRYSLLNSSKIHCITKATKNLVLKIVFGWLF